MAAPARPAANALLGTVAGSDASDTAVSSIGDARVSAAFSLGYETALVILHGPSAALRDAHDGRWDPVAALTHIRSKRGELQAACETEGVTLQPMDELEDAVRGSATAQDGHVASRFDAATAASLEAVSQRLGRAYRLGRSIARICRADDPRGAFATGPLTFVYVSLTYLGSAFPPYAARAVKRSVAQWAAVVGAMDPAGEVPVEVQMTLRSQADAWYGLLSGEIVATDLLDTENYLHIARTVSRRMQRLLLTVIQVYWAVAVIIVALLVGGVLLIVENGSAASGVAGIFAFVGSLGLGAKGINVVADLRKPLFDLELADAIADAVTVAPVPHWSPLGAAATAPLSDRSPAGN